MWISTFVTLLFFVLFCEILINKNEELNYIQVQENLDGGDSEYDVILFWKTNFSMSSPV